MHKQKVELNMPQLILAKIAQLGRHETVNTRSVHFSSGVAGSIPVIGNFFAEFILLLYNSGRTVRMIYFRENSIIWVNRTRRNL